MEDNDEIIRDNSFEEVDENFIKIRSQVNQNDEKATTKYLGLNLTADKLSKTEEHYTLPKHRRGRHGKKLLDSKSQSQTSTSKPNYSTTAELKLGPKYRPIRPKPFVSNVISRNKLFGISSEWNMSTLNSPNRLIVTPLPNRDKIRSDTVLYNPNSKANDSVKSVNNNTGGVATLGKETNNNRNMNKNSNTIAVRRDLHNVKIPSRSPKSSVELFFESMAQAVLNLPTQVQAEIKMEICKLVTMAEIKYCGSQSKHKTG